MPYWRLFYHFTWATKGRVLCIAPEWEADLHRVIVAKAKALGAIVYAVGGIEDHVHEHTGQQTMGLAIQVTQNQRKKKERNRRGPLPYVHHGKQHRTDHYRHHATLRDRERRIPN